MKRSPWVHGFFALAVVAGCAANSAGNSANVGGGGQGGGPPAGGNQGAGEETGPEEDDDDLFGPGDEPGSRGAGGAGDCASSPDDDQDQDGFSANQGDCNDCDGNINPGAIEVIVTEPDENGDLAAPADEDCDGVLDNPPMPCDEGLALTDQDAMNGARAVDLCQVTTPSDPKWGVLEARYVRADGTTNKPPYPEQYGLMGGFGPNVNPQRGKSLLVLSSGHARIPGQPDACGSLNCTSNWPGNPPEGFPQDVPDCPGAKDVNDDVGLELKIRSPKNATGYSFNFKFYSFEYPEWVCTSYNDQYISLVNPPPEGSISGNISFDSMNNPVSVNVAFFDVCAEPTCALGPGELMGTGFDTWSDAGGTGWLQTQAPVTGGQELTIRFAIWDTGDTAWDSTAVIDNFQWVANGGAVVVGTEEVPEPK